MKLQILNLLLLFISLYPHPPHIKLIVISSIISPHSIHYKSLHMIMSQLLASANTWRRCQNRSISRAILSAPWYEYPNASPETWSRLSNGGWFRGFASSSSYLSRSPSLQFAWTRTRPSGARLISPKLLAQQQRPKSFLEQSDHFLEISGEVEVSFDALPVALFSSEYSKIFIANGICGRLTVNSSVKQRSI